MAIRTRTCFTVVCDSCGHDIEVDADGVNLHYEDPDEARTAIREAEVGGSSPDGDFCSRCAPKPHAFVPPDRGISADECARCGDLEEDHAPVEVSGG